MGEAIIARGQTAAKNVLDDVPVVGTHASILTRVIDNRGKPIANLNIRCKDGTRWYNYTTNETGYALFKCNSGAANINAMNYATDNSYIIVDHVPTVINLDSPVGTKNLVTIKLKKRDFNGNAYQNMNNRAYFINTNSSKYGGNRDIKFLDTNYVDIYLVGGGSVGCNDSFQFVNENSRISVGWGGGGGALNVVKDFAIEINTIYNDYFIGNAGANYTGGAGGSTFGFGASANGAANGNKGAGIGELKGGDSNTPANYIEVLNTIFNGNNTAKGIGHGGYNKYRNNYWYSHSTYGNIAGIQGHVGVSSTTREYGYASCNLNNGVMSNPKWVNISRNTGMFNTYSYSSYGIGCGGPGGVNKTLTPIDYTYAQCTTPSGQWIYKFTANDGGTYYTTSSHSDSWDARPGLPGGKGCIFFTNFR